MTAPRTTSGSPLVTPPVRPPALFVRWTQRPSSARPSITSCTAEPNRRVCSNPRPNSTPLTMLMLMTAAARAASSRRSQWTYEPSPIGSPWTTTSNTPPTVSPFDRASSMRAIIARLGVGIRAPKRRGVGLVARSGAVRRVHGDAPTSAVNDQHSMPSSRRNARATPPAATRAAVSRADARSSTSRTSLKPYLSAPARSAWPGRTRVTGVARLLPSSGGGEQLVGLVVGQGLHLHDPRPVLPVAVADEQQDRRPKRASVSDAAEDLGSVLLDRLSRAAAVAALPAREVDGQVILGQGQAGRDALDRRAQRRAMRLPGGQEAERGHSAVAARRFAGRLALARTGSRRRGPRPASPASARAGPSGRSTA